jgi:hypothetical protein
VKRHYKRLVDAEEEKEEEEAHEETFAVLGADEEDEDELGS